MIQPLPDPNFEYEPVEPQPATVAVRLGWLLVNSEAGARLIVSPDQGPALESQPKLAYALPARFQGDLLDRRRELSQAGKAIETRRSVEFYGPAGVGKSMLLHFLAGRAPQADFPDGIINLTGEPQNLADLSQALFEAFYRSDPPFKPLTEEIQTYLRPKRALILLDEVKLRQSDLETLLEAAPQSVFLMASAEHHPWAAWQTLAVLELPFGDALRLVERALGRPPAAEEQPAGEAICNFLEKQPLPILQLISFARTKNLVLTAIANQLVEPPSVQEAIKLILSGLSEAEQKVMGVLAALDGASLGLEHLAVLTGLANLRPVLESLEQRYLIVRENRRVSLMVSLQESLAQSLDLNPWRDQCLAYFTDWAERQVGPAEPLLAELGAMWQTLQWAVIVERWPQILRLVRSVENAALAGRRWGVWEQVLRWGLQAAREVGDRGAEAWALHQLGTRALCLGEENRAENNLKEALNVRAELEDKAGAEVTKRNLRFLEKSVQPPAGPPTVVPPPPPPPSTHFESQLSPQQPPARSGWLLSLIAALLILAVIALAIYFFPFGEEETAPTPPEVAAGGAGLQINVTQLNFGPQPTGQPSAPQNVVVANSGPQTTSVGPIGLAGENPDAFLVSSNCAELAPGASCAIEVQFAPKTEGGQSANLVVASSGAASQTVPLYGAQVAAISANPSAPILGPWLVNTSTIPQPILVSNVGSMGLTIASVEIQGSDAAAFAFTIDQCTRTHLAPGQSCQVNVSLTPNREGNHSANLVIKTDPERGPFTVALNGEGLLPTPTFTPSPTATPTPVGTPSPTPTGFWGYGWVVVPNSLTFGELQIGASSGAQSVTLTNNGPKPLTVMQVNINGPAARDFTRTTDTCAGATLAAGTSCTISIIFSPWEAGVREAALIIGHNAAQAAHPVMLTGKGLTPQKVLCPEPATLDFGQQQVNTSSPEKIITLRNCSAAPLTIQHLSLDGDNPGDFTNWGSQFKCDGVALPVNGICTAGFRFAPAAAGIRTAILTIKHTGPGMTQEARLEGLGVSN